MYRIKEILKDILVSYEFYFSVSLIYFELFFHFMRFDFNVTDTLTIVLFSICFGVVIGIVASLLRKKGRVIYTVIVSILIYLYFIAQLIYNYVFNSYLSISGVGEMTNQAVDFRVVVFHAIIAKLPVVLLWLIPLLFYIIIGRKILSDERHKLTVYLFQLLYVVIFGFYIYLFLFANDSGYNSGLSLISSYDSVDKSIEKLGVMESAFLDAEYGVKRLLGLDKETGDFARNTGYRPDEVKKADDLIEKGTRSDADKGTPTDVAEKITEEVTTEEVIDTSPNVLNIDFDKVNETAGSESITAISDYLKTAQPTNKNEYTGMFEGYNLIFIVAEGFDGYVIDPTRTPTLYKMAHQGFCFNNFYTPLWYGSTSGGEYADLVGLMPRNGGYLSMKRAGDIQGSLPFTLGNQAKRNGYNVFAFHDNSYSYYNRNITHPLLGYDNWTGIGNGLPYESYDNGKPIWPQSDLLMEENTFELYKDKEPFHTYYLTVSGHLEYNFGGNAMSMRHKDLVDDLPYGDETKAYVACQYELELMLDALLSDLKKEGISEHTVIALVADHIPYNSKTVVDELAGKSLDSTFEWHKNTFILYCDGMDRVSVNKVAMSLDVLPTISNLMGFDYDSRLLAGQDILSDNEGLVIFNDGSFMTDSCRFNASTGEVTGNMDQDYIDYYMDVVKNKKNVSDAILTNNYYKYIEEYIPNGQD